MFSLTTTEQYIFRAGTPTSVLEASNCSEYFVYCDPASSNDALVFIHGITGVDDTDNAHWATIAKGLGVVFKHGGGIGSVRAKTASGTATLNAFPAGQDSIR